MLMLDDLPSSPNFFSENYPAALCRDRLERVASLLFDQNSTAFHRRVAKPIRHESENDLSETVGFHFDLSNSQPNARESSANNYSRQRPLTSNIEIRSPIARERESVCRSVCNKYDAEQPSQNAGRTLQDGLSPKQAHSVLSSKLAGANVWLSSANRKSCSSAANEPEDLDIDDLDERPFKRRAVGSVATDHTTSPAQSTTSASLSRQGCLSIESSRAPVHGGHAEGSSRYVAFRSCIIRNVLLPLSTLMRDHGVGQVSSRFMQVNRLVIIFDKIRAKVNIWLNRKY